MAFINIKYVNLKQLKKLIFFKAKASGFFLSYIIIILLLFVIFLSSLNIVTDRNNNKKEVDYIHLKCVLKYCFMQEIYSINPKNLRDKEIVKNEAIYKFDVKLLSVNVYEIFIYCISNELPLVYHAEIFFNIKINPYQIYYEEYLDYNEFKLIN